MAINFDKALGVHQQALMLRQQRMELLANNIANADTPGYKARDIDFKQAMGEVSAGQQLSLSLSNGAHIASSATAGSGTAEVMYRVPQQPSLDGNTVEESVEQTAFADNTLRYQATMSFLSSRFAGMKSVLSGGQ
ncbi:MULTISPECIES: flagellar basal body rod protein FlgB [Spongiibacter]|uniref:flagellar basal body rod protein FlgB n=2 Tax=Spongiibacteraceae TaxID=1706375 RepID=UPI001B0C80BC|nr:MULTISPECIES: flagellar basal body rod protein FlgB [Spongiibacter]MBO6753763.1 flagellar basal body rod protein FlgB [Spongiibacter sp.]